MLVWLGAALALRAVYAGKVLPGVQMAGIRLGGASEAEVRRRLAGDPANAVLLTHTTDTHRVHATEAGIDLDASVHRAMAAGREGPLRGVWSSVVAVVSRRAVEPAYPSTRATRRVVADIARDVDRPPFLGSLAIDPLTLRATTRAPRPGRVVDRRATAAALVTALRRGDREAVPVVVRARRSVAKDRVEAVRRQAERYLASGLRLALAGSVVEVEPRDLANVLALEPVDHPRRPRVRLGTRDEPLEQLVAAIAADHDREPLDARISAPAAAAILSEKLDAAWAPRSFPIGVSAARPGRAVDQPAAVAAVAAALRRGRDGAVLPVRDVPARISTRAARSVESLIGTFTTSFACCEPRVTNIRLIADAVDGTVIAPGERFSLNEVAGPRTRAKGYLSAPFIVDGEIVPSVGGGVSQMSTTVYNAAFFAGLRIDAHVPHSFYISRYPPGREATLDYPGIDLVWTNDTDSPVLVRAATTETSVSVALYGDNGGRRVRAEAGPRQAVPGRDFAMTVTREIAHPGGGSTRESYTTTYDRPPAG